MAATAYAFDPSKMAPAGARDWSDPDSWPDPDELPAGAPAVDPFDLDLLPEKLRPWTEDLCERMQIPADFPAAALIVEAGSLIGRQALIKPKRHDDWTVCPNLFGLLIGRPGLLKTPALREALAPLQALESAARIEHEEAMRSYKAQLKVHKIAAKLADGKIEDALKKGGAKVTREQMVQQILEGEAEPEEPKRRRFVTNDATVEKLGEILRDNPNGVLINRDELMGLLRGMERDGHEQDRAFYLEAWDGLGRFTYDRIGRGTIDIESCVVSILGAVCPGPFQAWVSACAAAGRGDDGFLQRMQVAVWPDSPGEFVNVDRPASQEADKQRREAISGLAGVGGEVESAILRFDAEAQDLFDAWRIGLENRVRAPDTIPAWESYLAKQRSLLPSIALICHLIDEHRGAVGCEQWLRAEAWGE
jgi:hypothetical protein